MNGPEVDFYLCKEASDIDLSTYCKSSMWDVVEGSKPPQVQIIYIIMYCESDIALIFR